MIIFFPFFFLIMISNTLACLELNFMSVEVHLSFYQEDARCIYQKLLILYLLGMEDQMQIKTQKIRYEWILGVES